MEGKCHFWILMIFDGKCFRLWEVPSFTESPISQGRDIEILPFSVRPDRDEKTLLVGPCISESTAVS